MNPGTSVYDKTRNPPDDDKTFIISAVRLDYFRQDFIDPKMGNDTIAALGKKT